LKYEAGALALVATHPRRDRAMPFDVAEHLDALRSGDERLFDYRVLAADDSVLEAGRFIVPLHWDLAYEDPRKPGLTRHGPSKVQSFVVSVLVSASARAQFVEVSAVEVGAGASERDWKRTPLAKFDLAKQGK
jgi:hypothetical protein